MNEIIKTRNLTKSFSGKKAVDDLTLAVPENVITGLIGRNGSGKTTLMKMCAGLLDKSGGEVRVLGEEPMDNLKVLSRLVYTYHDLKFEKSYKLKDLLSMYNIMYQSFDIEFANKLVKYFDLSSNLTYIDLSQGMASVFNFICGLACRAPLTMFDEPVLGMDVTVRKSVYEVLLRDYTENPRTIIISSHLLNELEGVLFDMIVIHKGALMLHAGIDEIRGSAYLVEGESIALKRFLEGINKDKMIYHRDSSTVSNAVIYERPGDNAQKSMRELGLKMSGVRPEELYVYLTKDKKEDELECLWQKTK